MEVFDLVKEEIIRYMPIEYYCHLQFVLKVARELHAVKGGDLHIIETGAICHDYGRGHDGDNSMHAEVGSEKIKVFLQKHGCSIDVANHIARCTLMHNKTTGFETIEEEIVANADQLSKVIYHDAFMLLVKKETFQERARWGLKYLEKGFNNSTFTDIREAYRPLYEQKKQIFESVLQV